MGCKTGTDCPKRTGESELRERKREKGKEREWGSSKIIRGREHPENSPCRMNERKTGSHWKKFLFKTKKVKIR